MRQITVTVPDHLHQTMLEYINKMPNTSLVSDVDITLTDQQIKTLEERQKAPIEDYISLEEVRNRIRKKYEF